MQTPDPNPTRRRVVITGMGTLNPLGLDATTTWNALIHGRSGISPISQFDATGFETQIAGEVTGFDPVALFGAKNARRMARLTQLALAAAGQAMAEAGLDQLTPNRERMGVLVGSAMGNLDPVLDSQATLQTGGPGRVSPFFVPMMLADTPAAVISIRFGLRGPTLSLATACATANDAIGQGAAMIRNNIVDIMVAGGTDAAILPLVVAGFGNMGALSTRNDDPSGASRPFDRERDGFVMSEGAGILVLEALDHAITRGATVYGELLGYGATADAYHISSPAEDGEGAVRAIRAALADAGLTPDDIDYINAHGTSTKLNDRSETAAIRTAFGSRASAVPVSSTKSAHGHLLGAAGGLEAIITLRALTADIVPPTINYIHPDPDCDLDVVPNVARPVPLQRAMSNSFGFGGHNAVLIFGVYPSDIVSSTPTG